MGHRPTQEQIAALTRGVVADIQHVRSAVQAADGIEGLEHLAPAMVGLETFCTIAIKLMMETNPSTLISIMRTVEIRARIEAMDKLEIKNG